MAIQDSDFFLVDDSGVVKKVRADKLKADFTNGTNLYSDKKLLVNTEDYSASNFVYFSDLNTKISNIGWMAVSSNGQTYKTSTVQISEYFGLDYTPPVDLTSEFLEISQRVITSVSSSDYDGPWDVSETPVNYSGFGRIYLANKITSGSGSIAQYNDICVAGVQVVRGGVLVASWIFDTSSGGTGNSWTTSYSANYGSADLGVGKTPAEASTLAYISISLSVERNRWSWGSNTNSVYTGFKDGIGPEYRMPSDGGSGTIAATGEGTVPQTLNTYYGYREANTGYYSYYYRRYYWSYASLYSSTYMRSPQFEFQAGDTIKVIHGISGYSAYPINPDDSLFIGIK